MSKAQLICKFLYENKGELPKANVSVLFKNFKSSNKGNLEAATIEEGYFKGILKKFIADKNWQKIQIQKITGEGQKVKMGPIYTPEPVKPAEPIKIITRRIKLTAADHDLFHAYKCGKQLDMVLSDEQGVMKGTSIVIVGPSGTGKSTVCYDLYQSLVEQNPDLSMGFLNSEMSEVDLKYVAKKKPYLSKIDFVLLKEYGYENTPAALEAFFKVGYDIVFIDSMQDIVDKLKDYCNYSGTEAETFFLALLDRSAAGENERGVNTANIVIQQVTKGGTFKGTNRIKHAVTAMLHLEINSARDRFLFASKNRRGDDNVMKSLQYFKDEDGRVSYQVVDDVVIKDQDDEDTPFDSDGESSPI